jgi:PAT family beta-lactamase induction signal transducer AmpG
VTLATRPLLRLFTLCILYVAQGIPYGFVTVTFAAYMAEQGLSVAAIGTLTAMSVLPWTFKWVWGPIIDRWGIPSMGRRRPWILLAQGGMIITVAAMAFVPDPTNTLTLLGWLILIHNCFNSLQDVSVDALAVDLLRESERGRVSGLMYGSKYIGIFLGGAVLSRVLTSSDLTMTFVVQVAMLMAIFLVPLLLRERPGERLLPWTRGKAAAVTIERAAHSMGEIFRSLLRAFSLRSTIVGAVIGVFIFVASGLLGPITQVLLIQDLEWTRTDYTDITGGIGILFGLAGAMGGGFLADLIGARRLTAIACGLLAAMYLAFGLASPESGVLGVDWAARWFVTAYILAGEFLTSLLSVALFAIYLNISWPKVAATQFTAYMALLNLSTTIGLKVSGVLDTNLSTATIFMLAGAFQAAIILLLPLIDLSQTRRVLPDAGPDPVPVP